MGASREWANQLDLDPELLYEKSHKKTEKPINYLAANL